MGRFIYIFFLLFKYAILYLFFKINLIKKSKSKFFKSFFEEAGGAFVKFGQLLALRIDILPKEYSLDLIELFDQTKPFSYLEVEIVFKQELGVVPEKIFKVFEKKPFASASFAQVHAAKLADGKIVVVKIQRPGIESEVKVDFIIISFLSMIADLFYKIEALPWQEFAKEFRIWTEKELDYHLEAENIQKIYDNIHKNKVSNVIIPKVYHRFSTKKILVQDYIDGVPLSRVLREMREGKLDAAKLNEMGIDIKKTPRTMVAEMLREYFVDGFFHADPHPGNILLLNSGRIGIVDFGIVGEASPRRNAFMKFLLAGASQDYKKGGYYFLQFAGYNIEQMVTSIVPVTTNQKMIAGFLDILASHFSEYSLQIKTQMIKDLEVMKIDYTVMILQTLQFVNRYQIKLPKQIIIFIRALSIFGFLAKELDYEFRASEEIIKFFEKYPEDKLPKTDTNYIPYRRLNKEEALDRLNSWLAYLIEIDPKLYQVVNKYFSQYNLNNN